MKTILDFIGGFTTRFWMIALGVAIACLPLAYCKGRSDGRALTEAEYAAARAQAVAQARKADAAATETAQAGKALSEAEIERGREAAEDADDPWRAATKAMKGQTND